MKLLILILAILALSATVQAVSISMSPDLKNTNVGQSFVMSLILDTATQIRGYSIRIGYDSSLLDCATAVRGSLFNGQNVGWWNFTTESPGITRIECVIFGAGNSVTGPGNLTDITFYALSEGYSCLTFVGIILYDAAGNHIPNVLSSPGNIIIGSDHAYAKASCFLQGAYTTGSMTASLSGLIPLSSPYPADPISVSAIPADVVDWVLAELKATPDGAALKSQAMWLHTDGNITSVDKPFMFFENTDAQGYYLAVKHRNHLPIASSNPVSFVDTGSPNTCNLFSLSDIHNPAAVCEVSSGIYAMKAGDANSDGVINHIDRNEHWRLQAGKAGYLSADFNLDGNVFPDDLNALWRTNSGIGLHPVNPAQAGLDFQLALPCIERIAGNPYLSFEIQLAVDSPGLRLGSGIILLSYDSAPFGSNLHTNNTLRSARGSLLTEGSLSAYNLIINDYLENCLAITYEYWGNQNSGSLLQSSPQSLLKLSLPILEYDLFTGLDLQLPLMQNQQYWDDNATPWNPVTTHPDPGFYVPAAPTGLTLETQGGSLRLRWDAVADRVYSVYSATEPNAAVWNLEASDLSTAFWPIPMGQTHHFYRITCKYSQYEY